MAASKLTLSVDKDTIEIAKKAASDSNMSVSKLFKKLVTEFERKKKKDFKLKPVNELSEWAQQLIIATEPTPDFDHKAEYHKHLEEKYGL